MFTGIIEETGRVKTVTNNKITILAKTVLEGTQVGDSISVNGVCLTVISFGSDYFEADVSPETLRVTALSELKTGSYVNLERAVQAGARLGGHIVSGHIDGVGRGKFVRKNGDFYNIGIELPSELTKYVAKKGSIAVNGISLTVADIEENGVSIAVIPHTFENTNLKDFKVGDFVNIETDILAKYVEKFLSTDNNKSGISMEFLTEHGF